MGRSRMAFRLRRRVTTRTTATMTLGMSMTIARRESDDTIWPVIMEDMEQVITVPVVIMAVSMALMIRMADMAPIMIPLFLNAWRTIPLVGTMLMRGLKHLVRLTVACTTLVLSTSVYLAIRSNVRTHVPNTCPSRMANLTGQTVATVIKSSIITVQ